MTKIFYPLEGNGIGCNKYMRLIINIGRYAGGIFPLAMFCKYNNLITNFVCVFSNSILIFMTKIFYPHK